MLEHAVKPIPSIWTYGYEKTHIMKVVKFYMIMCKMLVRFCTGT
jgi:hypothetical protein